MKKKLTMQEQAFRALKEAVKEVVDRHRESGRPLAIWRNGKVVSVLPKSVVRKRLTH